MAITSRKSEENEHIKDHQSILSELSELSVKGILKAFQRPFPPGFRDRASGGSRKHASVAGILLLRLVALAECYRSILISFRHRSCSLERLIYAYSCIFCE